jgi:PAS domain S-box-containing protein
MSEKKNSRSRPHQIVRLQNAHDERFLHYFKNNPVPTYAWRKVDAEFILTDYNDAGEKITRGHIADCVGNKASDFYRDMPDIIDDFTRCFAEKTTFKREMNYRFRTTGEVKRLIIHYIFVPSDFILIHAEDVTEREIRDAELRQSEEKFKTVLENSRDILYHLNLNDGTFDYLSPAAERITGYTVEELTRGGIAKTRSLIHPDDLRDIDAQSEKLITDMLEGQMGSTIEYRITTKGGDVRWISDSRNLLLSPEGVPVAVVGTSRDVTERKRREEQVSFQSNVLTHVRDAVITLDAEYRITYWNTKAEELYGVKAGEALGLKLTDVYQYRWLRPEDEQLAFDSLNVNGTWFGENIHIKKSGEEIYVESSVSVLKDGGGTAIGFLAVMRDITGRKRTEAALQESEANYHALIETLPVIVYVAKPVSPYSPVYVNSGIETLGYSTAEWFATPDLWVSLLHPEDRERVLRATEDAMMAGQPTEYEYRMVTREGEVRWFHDRGAFVVNEQGERTAWQGVIIDITERKRAEVSLLRSEGRFRSIIETTKEWVWAIDLEGRHTYSNPAVEAILGYVPEELVGESALPLMHEDDRRQMEEMLPILLRERRGWEGLVLRWRHKDGSYHYLESNAVPILEAGNLIGFQGTDRDITKRKRTEEALEESEKLYRLIVETANEGIWLLDLDGKIQFINPQAAELLGYTVEEMRGRNAFDFLFHEDQKEAQRRFAQRKDGYRPQAEFRAQCKDGSKLRILTSSAPVRNMEGEVTGLLGMLIDITEQKRAEEEKANLTTEVEWQQERLISIVANVPGIVWETWWTTESISQRTGFVNDYVETMLGYSVEEWLSKPDFWLSVIYEEDKEGALLESSEIISGGERGRLEYRMVTKDGRVVWAETQFVVLKEEGQAKGLRGVTIDITERKLSEMALQQNHTLLRAIIDGIPDAIYMKDSQGRYVLVNSACTAFINKPAEEIIGHVDSDLFASETASRIKEFDQSSIAKGVPCTYEEETVSAAGRKHIYLTTKFIYNDKQGNFVGLIGVSHDITELRQASQALIESELEQRRLVTNSELQRERLAQAQTVAQVGSWEMDLSTGAVLWSDEMYRIYEFAPDQFHPTHRCIVGMIHPEDRVAADEVFSQWTNPDTTSAFNHRLLMPDGRIKFIEQRWEIIRDEQGKPVRARGSSQDITERVNAQERQYQSEAALALAQQVAHLGSWELDLVNLEDVNSNPLRWSDETFRIFGCVPEETEVSNDAFFKIVHPADRESIAAGIAELLRTGTRYSVDHRIIQPGGGERVVHEEAELILGGKSKCPLKVVGTVQDITERKQREDALLESEERFQLLARATNEVIWDWNIITNGIWWNEGIRTVFGYATNEVGGGLDWWLKGIHPDDAESIGTSIHEFFDSDGQIWTGEYRYARADGSYALVIDRGTVIRDIDGKPVRMIGSMRDVTELKSGEEKLRQMEDQLRQSQKLESIGLLAGGIAHDFNNMLTAINGYSELTLRRLKEDDPLRRNIEEIKKAGERSADLTHQLLAFSRQQMLQPKILSLNQVITDTSKLLERLIGENVQLFTTLNQKAGQVKVDPGQLSQIIMNLAINARDAMPEGGKITIETGNVTLDDEYARHHVSTIPGEYVMMSVSDTGTGMDAETQTHLF